MNNLENEEKAEALYKSMTPYISDYAIKCYEKVLELNPRHVLALWNLGCIYDGDHDHAGSGSYWDELYLANYEKAIDCFTRIIEIDPNFSKAYRRLGNHYVNSNKEKGL
jgi:tetratricopeptide (TPR) repeat protein